MRYSCLRGSTYLKCICLIVMCRFFIVILFGRHSCNKHLFRKLTFCSGVKDNRSRRLPVIRLMHLKSIIHANLTDIDYIVIIPSLQKIPNLYNDDDLQQLVSVLVNTQWLEVVTGKSSIVPNPFCTIIRRNWTLHLSEPYAKFYNNNQKISTEAGSCYPCDLLPETIIVRASTLKVLKSKVNCTALGDQAILFMQISLQGRMAYCPAVSIRSIGIDPKKQYGCVNRLGSMWDHKFPEFAKITGIYRLRLPDNVDAWLWCVFHFEYVNLPISCAEWNYEYIWGMDALMTRAKYEYAFAFGTALGAVRDQDVIPWTADVDIVLNASVEFYRNTLLTGGWDIMEKISDYNFSIEARDGHRHDDILRLFPRCPMILTKRYILGTAEEDQIGKAIKIQPVGKDFRQPPYIDIYHAEFETLRESNIFGELERYQIRNVTIKIVSNVKTYLAETYGKFWRKTPLNSLNFTQSFTWISD